VPDVALHDAMTQTVRGQLFLAPRAGEEPALIAPWLDVDEESAGDRGFTKSHE
jgi:hypothetical protein